MEKQDNPGDPSPAPAIKDRRINRLLEAVAYNPRDTVSEHADKLGISPSHLEHLYKENTGGCIREYIIRARMRLASRLLRTTPHSIKEIAKNLGYSHAPSFIRIFQRHHGHTPLQHRHKAPVTPDV